MPQDHKAYAQREKAYMQGKMFPNIRVGMIKVNLTPTVTKDDSGKGHIEKNAPVYIYDTSGPFSDPSIEIDLKKCITYNPKLASVIRNIEVLNTLQVDAGGYGITFNNSIYLDAETLCSNGVILPIYANVFYDFVKHSIINTTEACEILECSRQNLSYMVKQGSVTPLKLGWKENVFLRGDITGV